MILNQIKSLKLNLMKSNQIKLNAYPHSLIVFENTGM